MQFKLRDYIDDKQTLINSTLQKLLFDFTLKGRLADAMSYAVIANGKRLRPILCIAAGEAIGSYQHQDILLAGCAIEFIHTYSLIHDDLPAMDDDDLRRGKPTCHVAFDEATAILAGDGLLTLAFHILSNNTLYQGNDHKNWLNVIQLIAKASGARGMVEGQIRDLAAEGRKIDLQSLEKIHSLKTGALIDAAILSGAVIADADDMQIQQLKRYANKLGMAYQVVDDLLNIEGDPHIMGKAVGTDQEKEKSTYPALIGIDASKRLIRELVDDALHALVNFDNKSDPLRAIAQYVIDRKK
jgi:geranylgeranyl diphosphate synthase, type II